MDHYREADINKFAMIGAITVVVIGAAFWGMRTYAQQGLKQDSLEAPWVVAARAQQGTSRPMERTLNTPPISQEAQDAIARWRQESGQ